MQNKIFDALKNFETYLMNNLSIHLITTKYVILDRNEFYSEISKIYEALPQEIKQAKDYLLQKNNELEGKEIYTLLNMLDRELKTSFHFFGDRLVVAKLKPIFSIIDNIYAILPVEVKVAIAYLNNEN